MATHADGAYLHVPIGGAKNAGSDSYSVGRMGKQLQGRAFARYSM